MQKYEIKSLARPREVRFSKYTHKSIVTPRGWGLWGPPKNDLGCLLGGSFFSAGGLENTRWVFGGGISAIVVGFLCKKLNFWS